MLPLSRKLLWILFSNLSGNFASKNAREFWLRSSGLRSHKTKHEKSSKFSGKIRSKFGAKFGTKAWTFEELSFCNFSDLTKSQSQRAISWEKLNPGVSKPGDFPLFRERSRLCRGPFRDCSSQVLLIGRERGKGQIGKIPGPSPSKSGKSRKNRKVPKIMIITSRGYFCACFKGYFRRVFKDNLRK